MPSKVLLRMEVIHLSSSRLVNLWFCGCHANIKFGTVNFQWSLLATKILWVLAVHTRTHARVGLVEKREQREHEHTGVLLLLLNWFAASPFNWICTSSTLVQGDVSPTTSTPTTTTRPYQPYYELQGHTGHTYQPFVKGQGSTKDMKGVGSKSWPDYTNSGDASARKHITYL